MIKAISLHSVVPVRAESAESSEQTTQMLFGETCTILEQKTRWNRIKLHSDGHEGWVDSKMVVPMSEDEYKGYATDYVNAAQVVYPMAYAMSENNHQTIPLTAGTKLTNYQDGRFSLLGVSFRIDPSMVSVAPLELNGNTLQQAVRFFLNIPYLWGGKNAMGMDCSGFTQIILSLFGKTLLRNASEQITQGRLISDIKKSQAGDLVFFDHQGLDDGTANPDKISHVGIILDPERVIHCSGRVKVEKLDEIGIFNAENGSHSHHLVQIRRI
ncbi:MAG: C40 family peptidase [Paludibacteraceae bacterium]|nr:C40 family peptidase [Paludibacteraceae bacterium]